MKTNRLLPLLLLLAGCGQPYNPVPQYATPGVHGGDGVFGNTGDHSVYATVPFPVLRGTITDIMGVAAMPLDTACQGLADPATMCPKSDPVAYLDANQAALGVPVYDQDSPNSTQPPGPITTGGFKVWFVASSSACGLMMQEQTTPALFPNGPADYDTLYTSLLGRTPSADEILILDQLRASPLFTTDQMRGTAVCSAVLGSLEFLGAN